MMTTPTLILTADPDFAELALTELHSAAPDAQIVAEPAPGIWLVTAVSFLMLAEAWRQRPPIFVRHVCPVLESITLRGKLSDTHEIADIVSNELAALIEPSLPFSVQTRIFADAPYKPFDINKYVSEKLQTMTGASLNVQAPIQIVSVVVIEKSAFVGLSLAAQNLSDWAGGVHRFARESGQVSRAEFKLLEALSLFQIELPPRGVALDLGAAPGGWTRVLRQKGQYVTAVDPAQLHPTLQQDKQVRHLHMTAEAYLKQQPDKFDLIVNDMRLDARDSARLMQAYAACLYRHGLVLMTLKLPQEKRPSILEHALRILNHTYEVAGARQLFHNRSEITLYLRPKQVQR